MGGTDESGQREEYGTVALDQQGRLPLPRALLEDLQLEDGTTFTVVRAGTDIRLVRQRSSLQTVSTDRSRQAWRDVKPFRDAGDATFGGH